MGTEQNNEREQSQYHGKNLKKYKREQLVNHVSDLYLKGHSYRQIAKQLAEILPDRPISIVTIGNMVAGLLKEWKDARINNLDNLKTVELNRIHKLEQTYWEGWEKSLTATERKTEKQRAAPGAAIGPDGPVEVMKVMSGEKSTFTEDSYGDPRFLAGIQWCIGMRCKILGIEAPIEFKGTMTSIMRTKTNFNTKTRNRPQ